MKNTRKKIAEHLAKGKAINSLYAFKMFKTLSLPQHIHALRLQGMPIVTIDRYNRKTGVKFAEYVLRGF